ncbi:hypothetical protein J1N35_038596, partial [Gossypium stocksii]
DIGNEQPYDSHVRRSSSSSKQWKHHSSNLFLNPSLASPFFKSSKTCAFTNLTVNFNTTNDILDDHTKAQNNLDSVSIGSWKVKDFMKRGPATKRPRSNWVPITRDVALIRRFDLRSNLISSLVEWWCTETHTFIMLCGECTITLEDVAMQLGLRVGDAVVTG